MSLIPPGSTLGVLGGGQLGRMFIDAAHAMGYQAAVLCPEADAPAAQVADRVEVAAYDDVDAAARFAESVAAVTYEFENVPAATAKACADRVPVRPGPNVLRVCQDRVREKEFLASVGVPLANFAVVDSEESLDAAVEKVGTPSVLKVAAGGYDGKGQRVLRRPEDRHYAWADLGKRRCSLEAFVDFDFEVSVIVARSVDGSLETFGPVANTHRNHILDLSVVPAACSEAAARQANDLARTIAEGLELEGVLAVEMFHSPTQGMLINELAPRPHNSGHLTIEACARSQFAQQVATLTGQSLKPFNETGSDPFSSSAAMVNLLGDLWHAGEPKWSAIENAPGVTLHLYGKHDARPGRKMGHLTAIASSPHEAIRNAVEARARVAPPPPSLPDHEA